MAREKVDLTTSETTVMDPAAARPITDLEIAYFSGPPEIQFFGRRWLREKAQAVTPADWSAMQAREDCAGFDFREI